MSKSYKKSELEPHISKAVLDGAIYKPSTLLHHEITSTPHLSALDEESKSRASRMKAFVKEQENVELNSIKDFYEEAKDAINTVNPDVLNWTQLPTIIIKEAIEHYKCKKIAISKLTNALALSGSSGINIEQLQIARLDENGIAATALQYAYSARQADNYPINDPAGRPQHDAKYWRRSLRTKQKQILETVAFFAGLVGKGASWYISKTNQTICEKDAERQAEWVLRSVMTRQPQYDSKGKVIEGKEALSIPLLNGGNGIVYKKISEIYAALLGIQQLSVEQGLRWRMITFTCPAHMHSSSINYDGTTPNQANRWQSARFKELRRTLANWKVKFAGSKNAEPHKSGCPHIHAAVCFDPTAGQWRVDQLKEFLGNEWNAECERKLTSEAMTIALIENAIERHYIDLERDAGTGRLIAGVGVNIRGGEKDDGASFASYSMAYVFKSFGISKFVDDGKGDYQTKVKLACEAASSEADAWARTHKIKRFSLLGAPTRTPYRELRKVKAAPSNAGTAEFWNAAHDSDMAEYMRLQGGLIASRNQAKLKTVWDVKPSLYALEPQHLRTSIIGVQRIAEIEEVEELDVFELRGSSKSNVCIKKIPVDYLQTRTPGLWSITSSTVALYKEVPIILKPTEDCKYEYATNIIHEDKNTEALAELEAKAKKRKAQKEWSAELGTNNKDRFTHLFQITQEGCLAKKTLPKPNNPIKNYEKLLEREGLKLKIRRASFDKEKIEELNQEAIAKARKLIAQLRRSSHFEHLPKEKATAS